MPFERAENPRLAQTVLRSGSLAGVKSPVQTLYKRSGYCTFQIKQRPNRTPLLQRCSFVGLFPFLLFDFVSFFFLSSLFLLLDGGELAFCFACLVVGSCPARSRRSSSAPPPALASYLAPSLLRSPKEGLSLYLLRCFLAAALPSFPLLRSCN